MQTLDYTGIQSSPAATQLCSPATAAAGTRPAPARREPRPRIPLSSQNLIPPLVSPRGAKNLTQVPHHTPSPKLATPTDDAPLLICHHAHPSSPRQPLGFTPQLRPGTPWLSQPLPRALVMGSFASGCLGQWMQDEQTEKD